MPVAGLVLQPVSKVTHSSNAIKRLSALRCVVVCCELKFIMVVLRIFWLLISFMTLPLAAVNAQAEHGIYEQSFAGLKSSNAVTVSAVIDPITLQLTDGRLVRFSGIDIPDLTLQSRGTYANIAQSVLEDLLLGQSVVLHSRSANIAGYRNRMGHVLAHIETNDKRIWVQGLLVSLGLARVRTDVNTPEMASQIWPLE